MTLQMLQIIQSLFLQRPLVKLDKLRLDRVHKFEVRERKEDTHVASLERMVFGCSPYFEYALPVT